MVMGLKDSWKKTGQSTGKAFANLGKAIGTTAKVAFTDEDNKIDDVPVAAQTCMTS